MRTHHGVTRTKEHRAWYNMMRRCYNPADPRYPTYGGRGITVCAEWSASYEAFLADMGNAPTELHSLDRIDNDSSYSKANCRWATRGEQASNKTNSRLLTHNGETLTITEWARRTGISRLTILARIRYGWNDGEAISTPLQARKAVRPPKTAKTHVHGGARLGPVKLTRRSTDLTGRQVGLLTVREIAGQDKRTAVLWWCNCECGNTVVRAAPLLLSGHTRSCGCLRSGKCAARNRTHGNSKTKEHGIWSCIKQRCHNPGNPNYRNYGARGIVVCDRWRHSFADFYADMGPRPSDRHSLDRIDNDGPYSPENCRWATRHEQNRNRRNNHHFEALGKVQTLSQWEAETGIPAPTIISRTRAGWPNDETVTVPLQKHSHRGH